MAYVFGVTSPNTNNKNVMDIIDMPTPFSPNKDIQSTVAVLAAAILTSILPTRIVARVRLGDKRSLDIVFENLGLFTWILFFWKLLKENSAVSEPEKNAENISKTKSKITCNILFYYSHFFLLK